MEETVENMFPIYTVRIKSAEGHVLGDTAMTSHHATNLYRHCAAREEAEIL